MKIWPILLLIGGCQAQLLLSPKNPDDYGSSVSFQNQNGKGLYDFGYTEGHLTGGSFRRESGDAFGNKIGTYGYKTIDGRVRIAKYIADGNGFRIHFTTNEPGVAPQNPAFVSINKPIELPIPAAAVPVPPAAPVALPPPPPPPLPAVSVPPKVFPPPPVSYNYITPAAAPVAIPPPSPPDYFPPIAQVAAPYAPVAIAPFSKRIPAYPPPPLPPPQPYYTNLVQGKGYVSAVNTYPSLYPPLPAAPPQYNFLSYKSPRPYQGELVSIPL